MIYLDNAATTLYKPPEVGQAMLDALQDVYKRQVLSCSVLAARADGHRVTTLEGLQEEAAEFGAFIADQGAEQCGFCNPGFIMNALALFRENPDPGEDEIKEYLAGNLCRCSGYEGQLRGILNFLAWKKGKEAAQ